MELTFAEAFNRFAEELRKDESLYYAYQSNIAMSFCDTINNAGIQFPQLHELSNIAAKNFLNLLIKKELACIKIPKNLHSPLHDSINR